MVECRQQITLVHHIFIIGAKCIGQYGGYETFLDKLTEQHQDDRSIQYYIVTKANGNGHMDETKLMDIIPVDSHTFIYHNARVTKISVPQIGPVQAIVYDIKAIKFCLDYCKTYKIASPIFYILACRIGPCFRKFAKEIHELGGKVFINPDGHEWKRAKWPLLIRRYWKESERMMVKSSDLVVCDSLAIEEYIQSEYGQYKPRTTFIAYGADTNRSNLEDSDPKFTNWLQEKKLRKNEYYICCGRFVPENSFEIMIREFMKSHSKKDFAIITTRNDRLLNKLDRKLHFKEDERIKFVGTLYDKELLKKIRENAYGNLHGHTVGGTNPSLLEALASTELNLLIDIGFNREVAEDTALYWGSSVGELSTLIDRADQMGADDRAEYGRKAKERIKTIYNWGLIGDRYRKLWNEGKI